MGARISVTIRDKEEYSPTVCFHWGGEEIQDLVKTYETTLLNYLTNKPESQLNPIDRLDIGTIFADFLRYAFTHYSGMKTRGTNGELNDYQPIDSDIYIEREGSMVDDSDYGNITISIPNLKERALIIRHHVK